MNTQEELSVQILQGATSEAETHVFIKVDSSIRAEDVSVEGPFSQRAETLSSKFQFVDVPQNSGSNLKLLKTEIIDPLFWTTRNPALYRCSIQAESLKPPFICEFGIRDLHTKGRDLIAEDRRWVLRAGVADASTAVESIEPWRNESMAMLVSNPSDELCLQATLQGLFLIVEMTSYEGDFQNELERLVKYSAVAAVLLLPSVEFKESPGQFAPHLLLGCLLRPGESAEPADIPKWAKFVVHELFGDELDIQPSLDVPEMIWQNYDEPAFSDPRLARAACDELQREIKGTGEFAGIWVGHE
ncbi:MAG: hypothetical protein COA78_07450 [Blastopirellula sp.]|nr:MAG: hypothetical protein COA78_07450 [Blastopirellula sp.]